MKRIIWLIVVAGIMMGCAAIQTQNSAQEAFDRGFSLFNEKRYDDAETQFKTAVELDPEFSKGHLYLGKSYIYQYKWLEAAKSLKTAYQLAPKETKKEAFDILSDAVIEGAEQLSDLGKLSTWLSFLADTMAKHPELAQNVQETAVKMTAMARKLIDAENYKPALEIVQHLIGTTSEKVGDYLDLVMDLTLKGYPLKKPESGN